MINRGFRRSRAGIAQAYIIAGAVAAAAIGGYFLYQWWKSNHPSNTASNMPGQYQQGYSPYGGPVSGGMLNPTQMGKGGYYAMAPGSTQPGTANETPQAPEDTRVSSDRSSMDDPELAQLYAAERDANSQLVAAMASGDSSRTGQAQAALAQAQNALTIKKRSMLQ